MCISPAVWCAGWVPFRMVQECECLLDKKTAAFPGQCCGRFRETNCVCMHMLMFIYVYIHEMSVSKGCNALQENLEFILIRGTG